MHTIKLMAVDSRYATEDELAAAGITGDYYPSGWRLMAHQAKTVQALKGDAQIVVNTAMTGDGKSLAGQLQLFNDTRWRTLTMYPTNELALDQQMSLKSNLKDEVIPVWGRKLRYGVLNATELDDIQAEYADMNISRAEALQKLLNSDYLLTNPDIFHLAISFAYRKFGTANDTTLGKLARIYRQFVFDEFHLFGTPQVGSVLLAIVLLRHIMTEERPPRFLFLSATPQNHLVHLAEKVGLKVSPVAGEYVHGADTEVDGYRRILRPVGLTLYEGMSGDSLETWCIEHLDDIILRFFREQRPAGAKGVIIANSVATAHRIEAYLKPLCKAHGIEVELNTGLTPKSKRARDCDLLVGTSTIDVGIDFKINLLIFESTDAASHMQRLGRLGRHAADSNNRQFNRFEAHALIPPWVVEAVQAKIPADSAVSREEYRQILTDAYPSQQVFEHYVHRWAGIQAGGVISDLQSPEIRSQYEHLIPSLKSQYQTLFGSSVNKYRAILREGRQLSIDTASSFRGDTPFTVLVRDMTKEGDFGFVPYNLLSLLRTTDLMYVSLKDAEDTHRKLGQRESWHTLTRGNPLAAFELLQWASEKRKFGAYLNSAPELDQRVCELYGFRLEVPGLRGLLHLNQTLEERLMVCYAIPDYEPNDVRTICRLGFQLNLLSLKIGDDPTTPWTVAFGRDALLLDSVWKPRAPKTDKPIFR